MRPRPIRPNIYLPVARFGVLISDWKFVFVGDTDAYSTPFLLDLKLWGRRWSCGPDWERRRSP